MDAGDVAVAGVVAGAPRLPGLKKSRPGNLYRDSAATAPMERTRKISHLLRITNPCIHIHGF
ncbi:MAG: hypothetical protein QXW41_04750 [Fervidicoccaceae archaeon]